MQKDFWDVLDIIFRPVNGLLAAIAVALLGYYASNTLREREASQTNQRVYTELMSSRELAESNLRKDMFLSIIQTFQRPEAAGLEAKMLNLEMLTYNFHESLNLKPLFMHLDREIQASNDPGKAAYVTRLNQLAREVVLRQLVLLEQVGQKFSRTVDFEKFRASPGYMELDPDTLSLDKTDREFMLAVRRIDPARRQITIELGVRTLETSPPLTQSRTFQISYFDFPMIDNTRLSRDQRAAVVLTEFGGDSAEITVVLFPGQYASIKERVSYDEVVERLRGLGEAEAAGESR